MHIKNYTTKKTKEMSIETLKTLLMENNVEEKHIEIMYENEIPTGLTFKYMAMNGKPQRVKLTANIEQAYVALINDTIPEKYQTKEHACNVAWSILKDWVESQLLLTKFNMLTFDQIVLPYVCGDGNETAYEIYVKGKLGYFSDKQEKTAI